MTALQTVSAVLTFDCFFCCFFFVYQVNYQDFECLFFFPKYTCPHWVVWPLALMLAVHVPPRAVVQCTAARTINVILQDCDCISQINALDTINYWGVSTIALIQPDIVDCCVMGQKKSRWVIAASLTDTGSVEILPAVNQALTLTLTHRSQNLF